MAPVSICLRALVLLPHTAPRSHFEGVSWVFPAVAPIPEFPLSLAPPIKSAYEDAYARAEQNPFFVAGVVVAIELAFWVVSGRSNGSSSSSHRFASDRAPPGIGMPPPKLRARDKSGAPQIDICAELREFEAQVETELRAVAALGALQERSAEEL